HRNKGGDDHHKGWYPYLLGYKILKQRYHQIRSYQNKSGGQPHAYAVYGRGSQGKGGTHSQNHPEGGIFIDDAIEKYAQSFLHPSAPPSFNSRPYSSKAEFTPSVTAFEDMVAPVIACTSVSLVALPLTTASGLPAGLPLYWLKK